MASDLIRVDFRGPSPQGDCLDCLVAMPLAVDKMRTSVDPVRIVESMISRTRSAFAAVAASHEPDFRLIGGAAQDLLYRYVAQLKILDQHTRFYVDQVVHDFFMQLSACGVHTFYILDNTLREDRFKALLELFGLAGISTTIPKRDGKDWTVLRSRLSSALEAVGHVAYIEPDSETNHLSAARSLAEQSACVSTLRNLAPEDARLEVVSFRVPSGRAQ